MEYCYDLNIYDLHFRISSSLPLILPEYFRPFLEAEVLLGKVDCMITVYFGSEEDYPVGQCDAVQRYYWDGTEYIVRIESYTDTGSVHLLIPKRFATDFCANANWLLYLALERQIIRYDRVVLHASAVIYKEKAYLFTAPSGGGKSTQARIWEVYNNAEVLNGDKVVLHEAGNELIAYGGPIAGSSSIYVNKSAPVAAIFQLEKGLCNRIAPLTLREGFLLLYSEAVKSNWDSAFNQRILKIIETMPSKTNLVRFSCLPDHTAAEYVLQWLEHEMPGRK